MNIAEQLRASIAKQVTCKTCKDYCWHEWDQPKEYKGAWHHPGCALTRISTPPPKSEIWARSVGDDETRIR